MVRIDIVTDPSIVQLEPVLFLVLLSNVPLVQFLYEIGSAYNHQALYTGTFKTLGEFPVLVFAKLTVPVIGKLTVVRWIEKHEIVWVVVLLKHRFKVSVQYLGP